MQAKGQAKPPLGIVYITTMSRADSALALALIHGFEGKGEARIGALAVCGSGLGAAAFCDAVGRFYAGSARIPTSNNLLPVGLAADGPLPADPPMVKAALDRRTEKGDVLYARSIYKISDTAEVPALVRNALTGQVDGNAVVVLSAPATYVARTLELPRTRELIAAKVRMTVVCDTGAAQDVPAARKVLAEWPAPVVLCGREVGEAARFPGSSIEKDFDWSPAHPVVDAYRAYRPMPYDAPSWDMAAVFHALHSNSGLFKLSEAGNIQMTDDGTMKFAESGDGKHRSLTVDPQQRELLIQKYIELASAKPVPRPSSRPKKA
jgi:hypothetical protein